MIDERANWRIKARSILALISTALALGCLEVPAVHAQNFMRSPSINIESRIPTITPTLAPRIDPNIAARTGIMIGRTTAGMNGLAIERTTRRYPGCGYGYPDSAGQCLDAPITSADGGRSGPLGKKNSTGPRRAGSQMTDVGSRTIAGQIVAEIDGSL